MKHLWAPWRMQYILSDGKPDGCIFCPGDSRDNDEDRLILHLGPYSMVMMNKYPYNSGHLLVLPNNHVQELDQLSDEQIIDLTLTVKKTINIMKQIMSPEGFNVGLNIGKAAGAGIEEHLHFHIVPRWNGDVNFMTILGEVRVVPEHLKTTYKNFRPYFEKF
ncbi:MAG: HIT domain-containing protein [Deltaproteobacteria bacterium]|nr:HIT domain-containing protein [Deltaproteobacteria bacterium]